MLWNTIQHLKRNCVGVENHDACSGDSLFEVVGKLEEAEKGLTTLILDQEAMRNRYPS